MATSRVLAGPASLHQLFRVVPDGLGSNPIQNMKDAHNRVFPQHSGPRILHYTTDSFPHLGAVTVNGTFCTGGLAFLKGTFFQAGPGVLPQDLAFLAKRPARTVVVCAKKIHHGLNRRSFPAKP